MATIVAAATTACASELILADRRRPDGVYDLNAATHHLVWIGTSGPTGKRRAVVGSKLYLYTSNCRLRRLS